MVVYRAGIWMQHIRCDVAKNNQPTSDTATYTTRTWKQQPVVLFEKRTCATDQLGRIEWMLFSVPVRTTLVERHTAS
jgi:hypothetical protein